MCPTLVLPELLKKQKAMLRSKRLLLFFQQSELSAEERPERLGAAQQHRRKVASLNKQILQKTKLLEEVSIVCVVKKKTLIKVVDHKLFAIQQIPASYILHQLFVMLNTDFSECLACIALGL